MPYILYGYLGLFRKDPVDPGGWFCVAGAGFLYNWKLYIHSLGACVRLSSLLLLLRRRQEFSGY